VPGVLTSGDVDIHVRVVGDSFDSARDELATILKRQHEHAGRSECDGAKRAFFYESF
jgi:hypothetical protein